MSMDLNKGVFAQLGPMYNQLLSMSPDQIMQTGAPEFLKIAAMQQQGKARQAMMAPMPPSSTVAQDVVQQTVAPTGIGALPISSIAPEPALAAAPAPALTAQMASGGLVDLETSPDMFNDRYYAEGGIVAFQKGGVPEDYIKRSLLSEEYDPEVAYIDPRIAFPRTKEEFEARRKFEVTRARMAKGEIPPTVTGAGLGAGKPGALPPQVSVKPLESPKDGYSAQKLSDDEKAALDKNGIAAGLGSFGAGPGLDIGAPRQIGTYPELGEFRMPEQYDADKRLAERNEMYKAMGVDPEYFQKQRADLGEETAEIEKRKEQEGWLALARAGLETAQSIGPLGVALAAGAEKGLDAYTKSAADIRADIKEVRNAKRQLAAAEQAQARGDANAEMQYKQQAEASYINAYNTRVAAEFERNKAKFEADNDREMAAWERQAAVKIAQYDAAVKMQIAEMGAANDLAIARAKAVGDMYDMLKAGMPTADVMQKAIVEIRASLTDADISSYLKGVDIEDVSDDRKEEIRTRIATARAKEAYNSALQAVMERNKVLSESEGGIGSLNPSGYSVTPSDEE